MKFCPSCGTQNWDTAQYCAKCGVGLKLGPPIPQSPAAGQRTPIPVPAKRSTGAKLFLSLGGALVLVFVIGLLLYVGNFAPKAPRIQVNTRPKIAVLDLQTIGVGRDLSRAVSELFITALVQNGNFEVVERASLEKILQEQRIQTSVADPQEAARIGKMAGAQLVLIGSIMRIGTTHTVTFRLVEVESGIARDARTFSAQSENDLPDLVRDITKTIEVPILASVQKPLPNTVSTTPRKSIRVLVIIPETILRQPRPPDPAAETEVIRSLRIGGFDVVDQLAVSAIRYSPEVSQALRGAIDTIQIIGQARQAEIVIIGEAFAEEVPSVGGGLVTYRSRVEARAIRVSDSVILVAYGVHASGTDPAPTGAAKIALANAGHQLAEYFMDALSRKE